MFYKTPADPAEEMRKVISNDFSLIRMRHAKQTHCDQIINELLFIMKKVYETVDKPIKVLTELGIIIFPDVVALRKKIRCR